MTFEIIIFTLWVICLISYFVLSWTTIVEIKLSNSGESVFDGQGSFDLRKVPSNEGDDTATYLCRQGYELGSKLGEGAYAVVREAYSNKHGRYCYITISLCVCVETSSNVVTSSVYVKLVLFGYRVSIRAIIISSYGIYIANYFIRNIYVHYFIKIDNDHHHLL